MRQAVILAGGKGTRLKSVLNNLPKPLAEVGKIPLLAHHLNLLRKYNYDEAIILVGHGADQVEEYIKLNPVSGLKITCTVDGIPKGTAGAVLAAFDQLAPEFLVSYADTMLDVDLDLFYQAYCSHKVNAGTLFLHPNDHPFDSDLVEIDEYCKIIKFHPYPHPKSEWLPNLVNAALYYLNKASLERYTKGNMPLDFAKDLFPKMLMDNFQLHGYISPEYIKDAGTPERLNKVRSAWEKGIIQRASLKNKQKAVFIDRDGTLNKDAGHLKSAEELDVYPFVGPALRRLNDNEWRSIIITNQPVFARGEIDHSGMRNIHARLDSEVAKHGAFFDGIFMCPHHPDSGYEGEISSLKMVCDCRKPAPGLIHRASMSLNIDLCESWFIGDGTRDLGAAEAANVSSILVSTGNAGLDDNYPYEPGFTAEHFGAAVDFILDIYPRIKKIVDPLEAIMGSGQDWFVGGLARSGKTTISAALTRELRRKNVDTITINLDRWLISEEMRGDGVLECYDIDSIMNIFSLTNSRCNRALSLNLPAYSRRKRTRLNSLYKVEIPKNCIILWEGIIALYLANKLGFKQQSIFVETNEERRKERFFKYDLNRGKSYVQSEEAWQKRLVNENPIILTGCAWAEHRVSLSEAYKD